MTLKCGCLSTHDLNVCSFKHFPVFCCSSEQLHIAALTYLHSTNFASQVKYIACSHLLIMLTDMYRKSSINPLSNKPPFYQGRKLLSPPPVPNYSPQSS